MCQAKGTVDVKALRQSPAWHVRTARSVWLEQSEQGREQEGGQGDVRQISQGPVGSREDFACPLRAMGSQGRNWAEEGHGLAPVYTGSLGSYGENSLLRVRVEARRPRNW